MKKIFKAPIRCSSTKNNEAVKSKSLSNSEESTGSDVSSVVESSVPLEASEKKITKVKNLNETKALLKVNTTGSYLERKANLTSDEMSASKMSKNDKKTKEKPLTDMEYEEIFSAVLSRPYNKDSCAGDVNAQKHDCKKEEKRKLSEPAIQAEHSEKNKKLKIDEFSEDSFQTPVFEDLALEERKKDAEKKKLKKKEKALLKELLTKAGLVTPPSKKISLPEVSPWGSHFAKLNSQGSSTFKPSDDSQSIVESLLACDDYDESSSSEEEIASPQTDKRKGKNRATALRTKKSTYTSDDSDDEEELMSKKKRPKKKSKRCSRSGDTEKVLHLSKELQERLMTLHEDRNVGLWVFCSHKSCEKQRYLPHVTDPLDLPDKWYCNMNPDPLHNSCDKPEHGPSEEEEEYLINNVYNAGSIVWARLDGYPWWPAMVDDCPDYETYYWLEDSLTPSWYNVVFFDTNVTRAWLRPHAIAPYIGNETALKFKKTKVYGVDYRERLLVAKKQAQDAATLSTYERLRKYSFISRYKKTVTEGTKGKMKGKNATSKKIKSVNVNNMAKKQEEVKEKEKKKPKERFTTPLKYSKSNDKKKRSLTATKSETENCQDVNANRKSCNFEQKGKIKKMKYIKDSKENEFFTKFVCDNSKHEANNTESAVCNAEKNNGDEIFSDELLKEILTEKYVNKRIKEIVVEENKGVDDDEVNALKKKYITKTALTVKNNESNAGADKSDTAEHRSTDFSKDENTSSEGKENIDPNKADVQVEKNRSVKMSQSGDRAVRSVYIETTVATKTSDRDMCPGSPDFYGNSEIQSQVVDSSQNCESSQDVGVTVGVVTRVNSLMSNLQSQSLLCKSPKVSTCSQDMFSYVSSDEEDNAVVSGSCILCSQNSLPFEE